MTIAELMAYMEKEDGRRLSLSSSNGGQYGDDNDENNEDDTDVLVISLALNV